jgi:hypothetical protein
LTDDSPAGYFNIATVKWTPEPEEEQDFVFYGEGWGFDQFIQGMNRTRIVYDRRIGNGSI